MSAPQFTREERERVLTELAPLVLIDRQRTEHDPRRRIWRDHIVSAFLKPFVHCLHVEDPDWCRELYLDYCRERAVLGSASATHEEMDAAERSASRLLSLLLGESCGVAEYRHVGNHGDAA